MSFENLQSLVESQALLLRLERERVNRLQAELTTLRDESRSQQLRLSQLESITRNLRN